MYYSYNTHYHVEMKLINTFNCMNESENVAMTAEQSLVTDKCDDIKWWSFADKYISIMYDRNDFVVARRGSRLPVWGRMEIYFAKQDT